MFLRAVQAAPSEAGRAFSLPTPPGHRGRSDNQLLPNQSIALPLLHLGASLLRRSLQDPLG